MLTIRKKPRKFLPEDFKANSWRNIKPYAQDILTRPLNSPKDFEKFLQDDSELNVAVMNEFFELDIKTSMHSNALNARRYNNFATNTYPKFLEYGQGVEKIIAQSPYASKKKNFKMHQEFAEMQVKMYNPANSALEGKDYELSMKANDILSSQSAMYKGRLMTPEEIESYHASKDPAERKEAWLLGAQIREKNAARLNKTYTKSRAIRHTMALNAGMPNYVDSSFWNTKEYSKHLLYRPEDSRRFHKDIAAVVVPHVEKLDKIRMERLGIKKLRPWDTDWRSLPDLDGKESIKPYKDTNDLCNKTERVLDKVDPFFGDVLRVMRKKNRVDLEPRNNKSPGGANYAGIEHGVPFTYANFSNTNSDLVTMVHEQGHAAHNVSMHMNLPYERYRSYSAEVCEFAAIGMEMLTYDHWDLFYENKMDCLRAKREYLESIFRFFPHVAKIDAFQHEIYNNPEMTEKQTQKKYVELDKKYSSSLVDWNGYGKQREVAWHRQSHIFSMPLYYLEYGIAYVGATQLLMNARKDKKGTVKKYKEALCLGEKVSIPEVYQAAGVEFDLSKKTLKTAMDFLWNEYQTVDSQLLAGQEQAIGSKSKQKLAA